MFFFWKPASTYPPRLVSASHFAILLVIRKSNIIHAQSSIAQNAVKKSNIFQNIFLMLSLSVECSFLQIPNLK